MTELLAAAALIITVLVAYLQLQKSQQASLRLQEEHLRNELKLKLYERFSAILFDASTALSKAGMQYYSILSTFRSRVEHGFNTAPTSTGADLSENAHAAQRALNRVVILLEEYEMVFARFSGFRRALSEQHGEFLRTHTELWSKLLIFLPFANAETGKPFGPVVYPTKEDLEAMQTLHDSYQAVYNTIAGFMIDLQIETQNELLGGLFNRQLSPRHPADPSFAVLRRDETLMTERPKGRLV